MKRTLHPVFKGKPESNFKTVEKYRAATRKGKRYEYKAAKKIVPKHDDSPMPKDNCPMCGSEFNPERDDLLTCPRCGVDGSTACCMSAGRGTICADCELEEDNDV